MGSGSLGSAAARVTESIDMDETPNIHIETKFAVKVARSKKLDLALATDSVVAGTVKKLLLLGAGGSGKSTVFKQMKVIYGLNYSEAEKKRIAPVIYRSVHQNACKKPLRYRRHVFLVRMFHSEHFLKNILWFIYH